MTVPSFNITPRWKEELVYAEGNNQFVFQCGWGVTPGVVYVPPPDQWDAVMPAWLCGRHDEVVGRLRQFSQHTVEASATMYSRS
ncbi:MAG: hypothetical protein QM770_10585 [Tepidisphaeraceae bacterium]